MSAHDVHLWHKKAKSHDSRNASNLKSVVIIYDEDYTHVTKSIVRQKVITIVQEGNEIS
jgi:hypothetical protein